MPRERSVFSSTSCVQPSSQLNVLAAVLGTDVCLDRGRHQPVERLAEQLIGATRRLPPNRAQQVVGHQVELARHVVNARRAMSASIERIDQDVRVPDRRHAVVGIGRDVDPQLAVR
jgi:hypothetical protein